MAAAAGGSGKVIASDHAAQHAAVSIAMFGALRAGLIVVNTNPLYTAPELLHQLSDSGATVILVLENFAHVLQKVLAGTQVKRVLVTAVAIPRVPQVAHRELRRAPPAAGRCRAGTSRCKLVQGGGDGGTGSSRSHRWTSVPTIWPFLQYTGGTTGVARAPCCRTAT